ncbi:ParB-like protein [Xanthobacter autotrophicus DSM 597]|uniref:ParB-like protein n=1 Tax=Xanthobacter wiegelii TaxID=3119913 RepID=UPI00372A293F
MADFTEIDIAALNPTQLTLGLQEVERRAAQMRKLSQRELRALKEDKAVPYVIGPKRRLYIIDHHHLCRALLAVGEETVFLGEARADWSDLDLKAFWHRMETEGLCWPIDVDGNRRPCVKIPAHVSALTDNPWRTLARGVRGMAYANEDTPFQEFMWGNYYRSFMTTRLLETDIVMAEKLAIKVSLLDEAQDLPGYLGKA